MRKVYKYPVEFTDIFELNLPAGAEILTVQAQGNEVFLWALVSPDNQKVSRTFRLAGTGHPIDNVLEKYIGTFQIGSLVFHLFEVASWETPDSYCCIIKNKRVPTEDELYGRV